MHDARKSPSRRPLLLFAVLITAGLMLAVAVAGAHLVPSSSPPLDDRPRITAISPLGPPSSAALTLQSPGPSPSVVLAYASPSETRRFALRLHQSLLIEHDGKQSTINTLIAAEVHIAPVSGDSKKVFISFEFFDLVVQSDGKPIDSPPINRLLSGLKVSVVLDPSQGLGTETIIAANPQVKRLISMLIDAIRQTYLALPSEKIGEGATWTLTQSWQPDPPQSLAATLDIQANLKTLSPTQATIDRTLTMRLSGQATDDDGTKAQVTSQGQGQITTTLDPQTGLTTGGRGRFSQAHTINTNISQRLDLRFELARCLESTETPLPDAPDLPPLHATDPLFAVSPCAQATKQ